MFFNRKKVTQPTAPLTPYVECRSWHGVSFHIRDTRRTDGLALCDYSPLDDKSTVTIAEFTERAQHQHTGWKYCRDCTRVFLLLHDDERASRLIANAYSQEAGRWCERCDRTGSHHTDRHDEFVMAVGKTEKG